MSLPPWQQLPLDAALAIWRGGRLGHALLLCGPARIGKRAVAEALASRLLCMADHRQPACGHCRSCRAIHAGIHPDLLRVEFEINENTGKLRAEILVEQIRAISESLHRSADRGNTRVAIIDPADAMNPAAANAFLKTLEEPLEGRYLLLVCERPQRLPATVLSRCQRIVLSLPAAAVAQSWLQAQGHAGQEVETALAAASGHPGLACLWLREGGMALRAATLEDWQALAKGRVTPLELALRWLGDPQTTGQRLRFLADASAQQARWLAADPAGGAVELRAWTSWFDKINQLRAQLSAPLKHELMLAGLLHEGRSLPPPKEALR